MTWHSIWHVVKTVHTYKVNDHCILSCSPTSLLFTCNHSFRAVPPRHDNERVPDRILGVGRPPLEAGLQHCGVLRQRAVSQKQRPAGFPGLSDETSLGNVHQARGHAHSYWREWWSLIELNYSVVFLVCLSLTILTLCLDTYIALWEKLTLNSVDFGVFKCINDPVRNDSVKTSEFIVFI